MAAGTSARACFLGQAFKYRGEGIRLLAFDSGMASPGSIAERCIHLADMDGRQGELLHLDSHALRVASLAAGTIHGMAPASTLYSADYRRIFPNAIQEVVKHLQQEGRTPHIISFSFSAPDNRKLRQLLSSDWHAIGELALCIAAAGHDGAERLRFPATVANYLSVGVCGEQGQVLAQSGTDSQARKPEILLPNHDYLSEQDDGGSTTINGTSAAVGIVAGLATLWAEKLRREYQQEHPSPGLLKSLLIASAQAHNAHQVRVLGDCSYAFGQKLAFGEQVFAATEDTLTIRLKVHGKTCIAAVAQHNVQIAEWTVPGATISLTLTADGVTLAKTTDRAWCALDIDQPEARECELKIQVTGLCDTMIWSAIGAEALQQDGTISTTQSEPVYLGVSASHNASACVLQGESLRQAVQLERLSRRKNDGKSCLNSRRTIDYVLASSQINAREITRHAYNLQAVMPDYVGLSQPVHTADFDSFDPFSDDALFVSHHLAHAAAAFCASGLDRATVLVADGSGGTTIGADDLVLEGSAFRDYLAQPLQQHPPVHALSAYLFTREDYRLLNRFYSPSFNVRCGSYSWGETYATVSQFIFGDWNEGSGKLMGLAPYGDAKRFGPSLLQRDEKNHLLRFSSAWKQRINAPTPVADPMQWRDLAARVQKDFETALCDWVQRCVEQSGCPQVAYSGGLALNISANARISRLTGVEELFVFPASNDAGIAIGAAALAYWHDHKRMPRIDLQNDYLGHPYDQHDVHAALRHYQTLLSSSPLDLRSLAERLNRGQIIGWYQAGAEFGPRALGHRSILAAPMTPRIADRINADIKFRESFRPFAPVVQAEAAAAYFELEGESPYMLKVARVRPQHKNELAGITHVDGTARVQTLTAAAEPRLHAVLGQMQQLNGIPVLLNTSLNLRGQPIVETPTQAIELLLSTQMDALVLGDTVIEIHPLPEKGLAGDTVLGCAPDIKIIQETSYTQTASHGLISSLRGIRYELPASLGQALQQIDGQRSLFDIQDACPEAGDLALSPFLLAFVAERLFLISKTDEPADKTKTRADISRPELTQIAEQKQLRLHPGLLRICPPEITWENVARLKNKLGITRISDASGFDPLGIPVMIATRPAVSTAQITATQGKGLTPLEASLSALMEAAERRAANHLQADSIQSLAAAQAAYPRVFGPNHFQGRTIANTRISWRKVTRLRDGAKVAVPLASVAFPYMPGDDELLSPRPCTTGLASGNNLAEAILHGLLECAERHSISINLQTPHETLLHRNQLDQTNRELLARMQAANYQVELSQVSVIPNLPTYVARIIPTLETPPNVISAGQSCDIDPQRAIRRALLEAAQSRVVATLGNREDLIRHAAVWKNTYAEIRHVWQQIIQALPGAEQDLPQTAACGTLGQALDFVCECLAQAGFKHILFDDLSQPGIDLSVARVLVPGMLDSISRGVQA
jgi:carbamoyltransferase